MATTVNFKQFLDKIQQRIEPILSDLLKTPDLAITTTLKPAMAYVLLGGGKRLRPALSYATCIALGGNLEQADAAASAVELIHCYSLVHDDLPAMDDDELRRGKPTCHLEYNEATAILVGDALQTLAFATLSSHTTNINAKQQLQMIQVLANAAGMQGMVQGQAIDMASSNNHNLSLEAITELHQLKTGKLIQAAVLLGAIASNTCEQTTYNALAKFGDLIGLSFQIQDDILDVTQDTEILGKPAKSDVTQEKATFVSCLGLAAAKNFLSDTISQAQDILRTTKLNNSILNELAAFCSNRLK